jgi:hypothetical protein
MQMLRKQLGRHYNCRRKERAGKETEHRDSNGRDDKLWDQPKDKFQGN